MLFKMTKPKGIIDLCIEHHKHHKKEENIKEMYTFYISILVAYCQSAHFIKCAQQSVKCNKLSYLIDCHIHIV